MKELAPFPVLSTIEQQPLGVVSSTLASDGIAWFVEAEYPVGAVKACYLARRGFNHVYELQLADGRRCIARLSSHRARGAPNIAYETALLSHLKVAGAAVAAPLLTRKGKAYTQLTVAEGTRALVVFEYLQGNPPGEALPDIEATGESLAHIYVLSQTYRGPSSRYSLDLPHLLRRPLKYLLLAPTLDNSLRENFLGIADRLEKRIADTSTLSLVTCHGDCHGGNTFVTEGLDGARIASFFDFDDAGPGYLAYDLAVYLWNMKLGMATDLDADKHERWKCFLKGYRRIQQLPSVDFDAITLFVSVRHFWFLGEFASRIHEWGSQALPQPWLQKQVELLTAWESIPTPTA